VRGDSKEGTTVEPVPAFEAQEDARTRERNPSKGDAA